MEHHNSLSSPNIAVGGLTGFSCQGDITKPPLRYYNMSVQETRSPRSAYLSQSNANKNSTHPISLLNEFRIKPLMQTIPDSFDEFNLSVTSESIHDEYSPRNPDKESIEDALFPSLGSDLCDQPLFSGHEPDLSEPTPSIHLNLNHHLTNLPANLNCPQDSRPVAVANPLNLQQGTNDNPANSTEIVGDKYSQVEHKKKCCKNPVYSELEKARKKLRYQNDPVFAEGQRIYARTYYRMKKIFSKEEALKLAVAAKVKYFRSVPYSADSAGLQQTSNSGETTQKANKNSDVLPFSFGNKPGTRELIPANCFSLTPYLTNPPVKLAYLQDSRPVAVAYPLNLQHDTAKNLENSAEIVAGKSSQAEHQRKEKSGYYQNNPAYAERQRQFQRKHRKNPAILKRERDQKRNRYHNDPDYAKRLKERKNHRYQKDSIYAECRRIYNKTYSKMKRKVSKEEASRLASIARAEFLQLVNSSEGSVDLPLTLKSTQTTQNSNKNVYILPRLPSQAD